MSEDLRELEDLKRALRALQQRVDVLERRMAAPPHTVAPPPSPAPIVPRVPVNVPAPTMRAPTDAPSRPLVRPARETLETRIGRDWLNRIGIASLVLGMAFFILYTFQYLGPAAKIAIGVAIAGGLLGAGVWVERRPSLARFGRVLIGGGWALLYFTTYAMHHIDVVRLVQSPLVDVLLLLAVAAGAVWHSLRYQSQTITALALTLGFLTTCISDISYFTLTSTALLVVALAWLVVRMRWDRLLLYGVVASYATHLFWVHKQIQLSLMVVRGSGTVSEAQFWLSTGFVALYWLSYNVALCLLEEQPLARRNRLLTATLFNSVLFVYAVLLAMSQVYRDWRYLFLLGVGASYWASDLLLRQRQKPVLATAHLLMGLSLMTLALPLKLTGKWLSFAWLMEVALLVWIGLRYTRWSYRVVAASLAAIMVVRLLALDLWNQTPIAVLQWLLPWRLLIGGIAIVAFEAVAIWHRSPKFKPVLRPIEAHAFHLYFSLGAFLLWVLTVLEADPRWLANLFALEAAATVLLGLWLADRIVRVIGTMGFGWAALSALSPTVWGTSTVLPVIGLLYGASGLYHSRWAMRVNAERWAQHSYTIAASILLMLLLHSEVQPSWRPVAWALEGAVLMLVGLRVRDAVCRATGAGVFLLLLALLVADFGGSLPNGILRLVLLLTGAQRRVGFGVHEPLYWSFTTTPWVIGMLCLMRDVYRRQNASALLAFERWLASAYTIAAAATLTVLLWLKVPGHWLSLAWAGEGLVLVAVGFLWRDKVFRMAGLSVFGLLVLKILFVDLAGAETIYRILSFIMAGAVLLAASFAYARFTARTKP